MSESRLDLSTFLPTELHLYIEEETGFVYAYLPGATGLGLPADIFPIGLFQFNTVGYDKGWEYDFLFDIYNNNNNYGIYGVDPYTKVSYYIYNDKSEWILLNNTSNAESAEYRLAELKPRDFVRVDGRSIKEIGIYAYAYKPLLSKVTLHNGIKRIGFYAFASDSSLKLVSLPEGLEEINEYAFNGCSSLSSVTIPSTIKKIGSSAFSGTYLNTIKFLGKPEQLGSFLQDHRRTISIYMPWSEGEVSGAPWGAWGQVNLYYNWNGGQINDN